MPLLLIYATSSLLRSLLLTKIKFMLHFSSKYSFPPTHLCGLQPPYQIPVPPLIPFSPLTHTSLFLLLQLTHESTSCLAGTQFRTADKVACHTWDFQQETWRCVVSTVASMYIHLLPWSNLPYHFTHALTYERAGRSGHVMVQRQRRAGGH